MASPPFFLFLILLVYQLKESFLKRAEHILGLFHLLQRHDFFASYVFSLHLSYLSVVEGTLFFKDEARGRVD
jgi:hypothetical protein